MVSDFFLPVVGGVEGHIFALSVELLRRGHDVIVITHHHPNHKGIIYLSTPQPCPPLKVYHLPIPTLTSSATLPNFLSFLPYLRRILKSEQITLVHGHGSLSSMAHEAIIHTPVIRGSLAKTVFTDHSLFGFADAVGVLTNKLLAGALRNADAVICVSHTGRENTVLRAHLDPALSYVIPNAVQASDFTPNPSAADPNHITIVVVSRLVYRKGIDLLLAPLPHLCALHPSLRILIAGSGPKSTDLEQMREKHHLQERITLLGRIKPEDVGGVLNRGQIYLNTSLTEAFGTSIVEAACAGLLVVTTRVGGVPEVLPGEMVCFAMPDEDDVIRALTEAIQIIQAGQYDPFQAHERVKDMYSWANVAERTEAVYDDAFKRPHRDVGERMARWVLTDESGAENRLFDLGPVFGVVMCIIISVEHLFYYFLQIVNAL